MVMPTVDPWSLGFTTRGNPPKASISSGSRSGFQGCTGSSGAQRSTHSGVGTPSCTKIRFEIARAQERPGAGVERDHLVPEREERLAHAGSRADGDLPLLARPSHEHRDLHRASTSTSATAIAAIPSSRPTAPSRSFVVAL